MGHVGHPSEDTAASLRLDFVTLFPEIIATYFGASILGRAARSRLIQWSFANPRDFAYDAHRKVDDTPYGGEAGMLMRPEPVALALESLLGEADLQDVAIIVTEPGGRRFGHDDALELAAKRRLLFVCGHYEGIDHRFEEAFATHVFSIGDFVLTGGELPALVMADAIARHIPGVLGSEASLAADSFSSPELVSAHNYTRPPIWRGRRVPDVLTNGDHARIAAWRQAQSRDRSSARLASNPSDQS